MKICTKLYWKYKMYIKLYRKPQESCPGKPPTMHKMKSNRFQIKQVVCKVYKVFKNLITYQISKKLKEIPAFRPSGGWEWGVESQKLKEVYLKFVFLSCSVVCPSAESSQAQILLSKVSLLAKFFPRNLSFTALHTS